MNHSPQCVWRCPDFVLGVFLLAIGRMLPAQGLPKDCLVFGTPFSAFRVLYGGGSTWPTIVDQGYVYGPNGVVEGVVSTSGVDERGDLFSVRADYHIPPILAEVCKYTLNTSNYTFAYQSPWRETVGSLPLVSPSSMLAATRVTRDSVWVNYRNGLFTRFNKSQTGQSFTFLGQQLPTSYVVNAVGTDGREMFCLVWDTAGTASWEFDLVAMDLRSPQLTQRFIAHYSSTPQVGLAGAMGRDQRMYLVDRNNWLLREVDLVTGATVATTTLNYTTTFLSAFVYDQWTDRLILGDGTSSRVTRLHWGILHTPTQNWVLGYQSPWLYSNWPPYDGHGSITLTNERPFEYFGAGCPNSLGLEPRLGWQGMPLQGQSFVLKLRNAEPNGFAIMWLGWSDSFWAPVGQLPFDGAPFGAPGCALLVAPDGPLPFFVDPNGMGAYTIGVPANPAIAGMHVFAQSVSTSGANSLGFASSDALVIRFR